MSPENVYDQFRYDWKFHTSSTLCTVFYALCDEFYDIVMNLDSLW